MVRQVARVISFLAVAATSRCSGRGYLLETLHAGLQQTHQSLAVASVSSEASASMRRRSAPRLLVVLAAASLLPWTEQARVAKEASELRRAAAERECAVMKWAMKRAMALGHGVEAASPATSGSGSMSALEVMA